MLVVAVVVIIHQTHQEDLVEEELVVTLTQLLLQDLQLHLVILQLPIQVVEVVDQDSIMYLVEMVDLVLLLLPIQLLKY